MTRRLPPLAILLGAGGLIPFLLCALAAEATTGTTSQRLLLALIGYGAVILAFLGAVHWGFELAAPAPQAERPRLLLGVLPSLVGWLALLVPLLPAPPELALGVLIAGFVATVAVEARARRRGLLPPGYMALRWGLSVTVCAVLAAVLVLRLAGLHVSA